MLRMPIAISMSIIIISLNGFVPQAYALQQDPQVVFISVVFNKDDVPKSSASDFIEAIIDSIGLPIVWKGSEVEIDENTIGAFIPLVEANPFSTYSNDSVSWNSEKQVQYLRACIEQHTMKPILKGLDVPSYNFDIRKESKSKPINLRGIDSSKANFFITYRITGWKSQSYGQAGLKMKELSSARVEFRVARRDGDSVTYTFDANLPYQVDNSQGDNVIPDRLWSWWRDTASKYVVEGKLPPGP